MKAAWNLALVVLVLCGIAFIGQNAVVPMYKQAVASYSERQEREAAQARAEGRLPDTWNMDDVRGILTARAEQTNHKIQYIKLRRGGDVSHLKPEEWKAAMPDSPLPRLRDYLTEPGDCYLVQIMTPDGQKKAELVIKNKGNEGKLRVFVRMPGEFADRGDGPQAQKVLNGLMEEIF